ncbi:MAG: DUF58 domain-containing protein [Actinomycetota bacterium]
MRLRKRAVGLLMGAGVLFFLGTNVQAGWLFVLAAMLLGVVLAGLLMPVRSTRSVVVERRAPADVHQGDQALIDVTVHGSQRTTRRGLLVHDRYFEPVDLWVGAVDPRERVEITTIRVARRRGSHESVPVSVRSSAPFGVAERRRRVAVESPPTLVYPVVEQLGSLSFVRPASTTESALHTAPRRGQGPEFLGIREYRPGDSMRHVHWASTARTGVVMVRELEQEQTRRLAIVADVSRDAEAEDDGLTPLDRVCSAAASIALAALAQGNGACLVTGDHHGDAQVMAGPDERELLQRLALVEPTCDGRGFPALIADAAASLRGVDSAVLVFPTWHGNDADHLVPVVESLAGRIPMVVAVLIVLESGPRKDVLAEERVNGLEQRLCAVGAVAYLWRPGASLAAALGMEQAEQVLR